MIDVADALQAILTRAPRLGTDAVPLAEALDRILRADARTDRDSPPFAASAMDGYAARRADLGQPLRVVGTSAAGRPFAGELAPGACVRILTGAPVPAAADVVIRQEDATRDGDFVRVGVTDGPSFIRRQGENSRAGDLVVASGAKLGPVELAALAAAGVARPVVSLRPRCAHLVTGDELVDAAETPTGGAIRDSNSPLIAGLLRRHGAELVAQHRLPDDLAAARAVAAALPPHDLLLVSGGAGAGDHDLARPLLEALGFRLEFAQVNLRPGRPLVFATHGSRLAFALPGNPVSHWVVFQLFVVPLLAHLQGAPAGARERRRGRLAPTAVPPPPDARLTFWPARTVFADGQPELLPLPLASSGDSSRLAGADALVCVPPPPDRLAPGGAIEFIPCP